MIHTNSRSNASPASEFGNDLNPSWRHGPGKILTHTVRDRLEEAAFISKGMQIEFEALQFNADRCGHIPNRDRAEVRMAGLGADGGEFLIHMFDDERGL